MLSTASPALPNTAPPVIANQKRMRTTVTLQVVGLCQFSYPAIGVFQVDHETIEERIAYLYDDGRFEERFQLFEAVVLPSLRAQTDSDF